MASQNRSTVDRDRLLVQKKFMKRFLFLITLFSLPILAQDESPLQEFMVGHYVIIGRYPDSEKTYSGTMTIESVKDGYVITREINGKKISGKGKWDKVTADKIPVLTIQFAENGDPYAGMFLIKSDLDNYARATGVFWKKDNKKPGLEAWFSGAVWDAEK